MKEIDSGEGEVSRLVYSFELIQDELQEKTIREEKLRKSQKKLLSCMSHDLRTPITTIKAHAEALRDGIVKTDEKKEEHIETIIKRQIS